MITEIEDYFTRGCGRCERFDTPDCSTRKWRKGLADLRRICRAAGLEEAVRWGHPCYRHAGRNVALIGALRGDFRLNFFNAALLKDPDGVLEKQGPNTQHLDSIRFTDNAQPAALKDTILAYLAEAKGHAEKGTKPPRTEAEIEMPEKLLDALDRDAALAEAFAALTPGRQRSYAITIGGAKAVKTRLARIAKYRDHILAGKGANER
ncbi:uncharacterized protein YdeI (YjbR/CyaY-like superfamily) [Novosphingobium kunmingense]|uniref:Uncharacterized protein YdeI (YjbR/CyaY-like superfamily) n=1 Tax=Novosphingobium kunmingense TaxID=1211806 RepID=A0A2N0I1M8_9SPHN|nr:YdeI/OmpD-associated family protein [Novosphingobium kunmingense]PKB25074.1 uncharacterized protein YdeI (YjbR/CyaY-like superfamily) [Novosphingobium kunmingense]